LTTIYATPVHKPRKVWYCEMCRDELRGPHIRMFGGADDGCPPYSIRSCVDCAMRTNDEKVRRAVRELMDGGPQTTKEGKRDDQ